jgi:RHS repeat-associated protein
VQTNYLGHVEENCQSLPFGDDLGCTPPAGAPNTADDATEHHFTGKERDTESGNDYFGARYYSSAAGRFMTPDWSAKVEPVPYSKLDNPQTLNLYSYVMNNPVTRADVDGHAPMSWGGFQSCGEEYAAVGCGGGSQTAADMAQNSAFNAQQAAQQQDATAEREQAAEANTNKNMGKYGPAGKGLSIRPIPGSCGSGNHNCQYELNGPGSEKLYVYEHQTTDVLAGDPKGNSDYVTPGNGGKANSGIFYDDIGSGLGMDTYRFFTVSSSQTYNPSDQHYVPINELGGTHGFEHMFSYGGSGNPVYINGSTNLSPSN